MKNIYNNYVNKKRIEKYRKIAKIILNEEREELKLLSEEELIVSYYGIKNKENKLESVKIKMLAVLVEYFYRKTGKLLYQEQIIGVLGMLDGNIIEMKTGEGKTYVGLLYAVYRVSVEIDISVFLVTVNEYLAKRDGENAKKIVEDLGIRVGVNKKQLDTKEKQEVYQSGIIYTVASEVGFDYLRDNLVYDLSSRVQSTEKRNIAVLDEIDNILIDDARIPLIISELIDENIKLYYRLNLVVKRMSKESFEIDEEKRVVYLTEKGVKEIEEVIDEDNLFLEKNRGVLRVVNNLLYAYNILKKDKDYLVEDGTVKLIDGSTGRIVEGRRFGDGIHSALEAKENVRIRKEAIEKAKISYQSYFKKNYEELLGMSGTVSDAREEFLEVYDREVLVVPTHEKVNRIDYGDVLFKTKKDKYEFIKKEVVKRHEKGQPILIGTSSVRESEDLYSMLCGVIKDSKEKVQLLNAYKEAEEARIIAKAGNYGMITVATNMAGRGTDILLEEESKKSGGLFVIGTERNSNRRIDEQLRGRSGRQGDIGESIFYLSLQDDLVERYGGKYNLFNVYTGNDIYGGFGYEAYRDIHGEVTYRVVQDKMSKKLSKLVYKAQRNEEGRDFEARKNIWQRYGILDKQRDSYYQIRETYMINGRWYEEKIKEGMSENEAREKCEKFLQRIDEAYSKLLQDIGYVEYGIQWRNMSGEDPNIAFEKEVHMLYMELLKEIDFAIIEEGMKF